MNGYVINRSNVWKHAMKRSVGPGQKVKLDELYDQYGEKHGIKKGTEFVEWLRNIKLKDRNVWSVVLDEETRVKEEIKEDITEKDLKPIKVSDNISPKKMNVKDVALLSVRKAREVLPEISDIKLLKYALQEANQLSNKDSLCRLLRKRIESLETAGFR